MATNLTPWLPGMDFGAGINSLNGEIKGDAVVRTSPEPTLDHLAQEVSLEMRRIDSLDDVLESLNISVEADGRYGLVSGSARFDFAKRTHITEYSTYFLIKVTVSNGFQRMRDVTLKDGARNLLALGKLDQFRDANGDCFVVGMQSGGQFFGLLEFSSRTSLEQKDISASLNFSFNSLTASASLSAEIKHHLEEKHAREDLSLHFYVEGGDPQKALPVKEDDKGAIDKLIEYARSFPTDVATHGKPIAVELMSYRSLDLPNPPNFVDIENQRESLTIMMRQRNEDLLNLDKIDYIVNHQDEFDGLNANVLQDLQNNRNLLAQRINSITKLSSRCADDPRQCEIPASLGPVAIGQLPSRKKALEEDPIEKKVLILPGDRVDWFQEKGRRRVVNGWQIQEYLSEIAGQAEGDRQGAAIYFNSQTNDAFEVHGDIYRKYKSMGAETSKELGFPASDEQSWINDQHGRMTFFEHGHITWLRATREVEVHTNSPDISRLIENTSINLLDILNPH